MGCKRPLGAITGIYALGMRCSLAFVPSTAPHALRLAFNGLHRARTAVVPTSTRRALWSSRATTTTTISMDTTNGDRKKVVFLGTPEIAASSLGLLLEASRQGKGGAGGFDVVRAVSNPPARTGRKKVLQPSAVQALADSEGVPVMTPATARDEEFLAGLEELQPDLCITAAYGQFLPRRFLDIPKFGTLNVHPSLLPLYRGASPVQRCLEAGDAETGVTVAFTVLKMDAGPVVRQTVRELDGSEKAPELLQELFLEGTKQLIDCLPGVWDNTVEKTPQDDAAAVKAAKISVDEARCCFKTTSATTIHNKVRAFAGWPGTWAMFSWGKEGTDSEARKVKLITTAVADPTAGDDADGGTIEETSVAERQVVMKGDALELTCSDGSVLRVLELQPLNKKVMSAKAFANGLRGDEMRWVELEPLVDAVPA
ncbi:unnamed protein product [Ectocarpus fasciculatus]